jgi:hypothetical protein
MNHEPYGGIVWRGPFTTSTAQSDPILQGNAIHWVLSKEVYANTPREDIEGWVYIKEYSTSDMAVYSMDTYTILSFRGTVTLSDFRDDVRLSRPGGGEGAVYSISRIQPAIQAAQTILNAGQKIQTTGHSLGGTIARKVSESLGVGCVTFNAAAPPSNPIRTAPMEMDYHIAMDVISAWAHPSVIRIDKGIRPGLNPLSAVKAHDLDLFSNARTGKIITNEQEDGLWKRWLAKLPSPIRKGFLRFIQTRSLPPVI